MVSDLELLRVCLKPEGCFGILLIDGFPTGIWTVEHTYPVDESEPRGAQYVKIPSGLYRCQKSLFIRGNYETYEITGVVGHSRLLFHVANDESDVDGCIGLGRNYGLLRGQPAVTGSAVAFQDFMHLMGGKPSFDLLVREA